LQTPPIAALADSPEFAAYHRLLQIFSYGTWGTYRAAAADDQARLPALSDAQALKLRQLSLLTLARDRANLSYAALQQHLGLGSARELEDLVITAIYAGLVNATLDPARQAVQVASVAPLRDLAPGAVPDLVAALRLWSAKCSDTLADLDARTARIRAAAAVREREKRAADEKLQAAMAEIEKKAKTSGGHSHDAMTRRALNKRAMGPAAALLSEESMELDEPFQDEEKKRVNKRKM
jgi:COP9 signalosome complex subunit 7